MLYTSGVEGVSLGSDKAETKKTHPPRYCEKIESLPHAEAETRVKEAACAA